jgi:Flp pilus assembly protein TadD
MKRIPLLILLVLTVVCIPPPYARSEAALKTAHVHLAGDKPLDALQAVQDHLQEYPDDPQGLFLKGLTLQRLEQITEAMEVYRHLIALHPELPEPLNNLAGLLVAQGRFAEAEEALQMALQTHPSYAAAYRNLNRIHSAMASQAYRRILGTEDRDLPLALDTLEELRSPR